MYEKTIIQLTPPYDANLSMGVWMRHPLEQIDVVDGGVYHRLFMRPNGPVLLRLEPVGGIEDPAAIMSLSGSAGDDDLPWAEELARWILHDFAPLGEFYNHLQHNDPDLVPATRQFRGLRPPLSTDVFETMVFAIVGQQVNLNFAYQCKSALETSFAQRAVINGREWIAGLSPEDFSTASVEDLRALKISRNKARAILELADAFRNKPEDRVTLAGLPEEEIIDRLTEFWGIGRWTAEYTLVRALGAHDSLPAGDAGLQNALRRYYSLPERPDEQSVRRIAEKWRPYRSFATYYLWSWLTRNSGA